MTHLFDLHGSNAIVTGSSRGIGNAIAEAFARHGANVVISSRNDDACRAAAERINALGAGRAIAQPASLSSKAQLQALAASAAEALGPIDVLVCNAATNPHFGPMADISDEQFEKVLRNNVMSDHWLIQSVAAQMRLARKGSIILMASVGAYRGSRVIGAYNVSKAAKVHLARNLAVELGPDNIRVNCISPGLIRTDFSRALWEDQDRVMAALEHTPLKRLGDPKDVVGAALFLASDASAYVTGQSIVVDGGLTATIAGI